MNLNQLSALQTLSPTTGRQTFRDGRTLQALYRRGLVKNLRRSESGWTFNLTSLGVLITKRACQEPAITKVLLS